MSFLQPTQVSVEGAVSRLEDLSLVMCGGQNLDSYVDEFRAQGDLQCTNVWSKGMLAYRCRTCQRSDSSAVCVDCFRNSNHWEHDFVLYHSESGGCCDCGHRASWKESGFCTIHQHLHVLEVKVKEGLLVPTHDAVQYAIQELLAWVKKLNDKMSFHQNPPEQETDMEVTMAMLYLDWSLKVSAVDALRSIFCNEIIEYEIQCQSDTSTSPLDILLDCLGWMPEKIMDAETTLLLQLLYKNEFKTRFLNLLKEKYENLTILAVINESYMKNYKYLDSNLDRVMVQLFNDPEMTTRLIYEYNLLEIFIGVFSKVITFCAKSVPAVVNVEHDAIKHKVYLRPQGDLRLIVSHGDIAVHMLSNQPHLFQHILDLLVKLQWMNPYFREDNGIEFDKSWTLAIQLEMNSMAIIFQLIARCYQDPVVGKKTLVTAATYTLNALNQYLEQAKRISEQDEFRYQPKSFSLHIPLHRTFSAVLQKLALLPWDNHERGFLSALLPRGNLKRDKFTKDEVMRLMEHPLRILVSMAQIRAQMWQKTTDDFSRIELIYRGSFWRDQSMDMDILLLQFCTVALENLQESIFIKIAEQFDFKRMATTRLIPERHRQQSEIALMQDFMKLILLIVRQRRNLGRTEGAKDKCLEHEVIQWLCVRDQTYSQLCRALSPIPMDHRRLNAMLEKVAIYNEPKVADRGYYQLKPEYWQEFDPLYPHYYLNEVEDAEDRAVKVGKIKRYWRIKAPPAAEAPYDQLSSLLHTKACHLFLLNVLDEVRYQVKENITATAGEALGVTALQLMAVLVSDLRSNMRNVASKTHLPLGPQDEFPTEDISVNIHVPIRMNSSNFRAPNSESILQMLGDLMGADHCIRLVDSVDHVLELLDLSIDVKSHSAENSAKLRHLSIKSKDRSNNYRSNDPVLLSNHKIFLSHSGAQKDFVEQLCTDLEKRYRFPFFDKRPHCLPKGERFPELILKATQQCQMAVVVVSEEYFTSKWPMIELHAFVQASLKTDKKLKILPLFYGLSVREFGNERRRDQWFSKWGEWAKTDSRINIKEWKDSLQVMASFNGIEYNSNSNGLEAYRSSIISTICFEIPLDIKWDDSHVQGRSNLCEAICHQIQQIQPSSRYEVHLVGLYGVGGIGKTTLCKTLCNQLSQEFEGKVCYIEFGGQTLGELLKEVLRDLTNTSLDLLQHLKEGECQHILREGMSKQRTFLIIDNVWDDMKSIQHAKMYLRAHYHEGSVVMVTSRSFKTLTHLGVDPTHCFEMLDLDHEDAKKLLLHYAEYDPQSLSYNDKLAIDKCVGLCYYRKGNSKGCHYLPLALKALGMQLGCIGNQPSQWLKTLPKLKDFNYLQEEQNPVFSIIRSSFDQLKQIDQILFMDVVLYSPTPRVHSHMEERNLMEWLSLVYNQDLREIESRLQHLKDRALLEDVDMTSQRVSVHDVYREFAKLECKGKLNEAVEFEKRRWVYCEDSFPAELEMTPAHRCWQNLTRIGILETDRYGNGNRHDVHSMQGIDWSFFSNVVVLKLNELHKLQGDLNLASLRCLRSLDLVGIDALNSLDGLQHLNNLTYFRWIKRYNAVRVRTCMGQFPASLRVLHLEMDVCFRPDVFGLCTSLSKLELRNWYGGGNLDFSNCRSLQSFTLSFLPSLETLSGLSAASTPNLQSLRVSRCKVLVGIQGLDHLVSLQQLHLEDNANFKKLPNLQKLTKLEVLNISKMEIAEVPGLGCLRQLRELECTALSRLVKLPNLSGFEQLQSIDISRVWNLRSLASVLRDLPALRHLNLAQCRSLFRLPDLSWLRNLEELNVGNSGVELREEDIRMLASLPLLHPVEVGAWKYPVKGPSLRLDVVKRKVLNWVPADFRWNSPPETWLEWTKWEERVLDKLPIKAKDIGWYGFG